MATATTTRLPSPEEIAVQAGQQVPYVRVPDRAAVFAEWGIAVPDGAQA